MTIGIVAKGPEHIRLAQSPRPEILIGVNEASFWYVTSHWCFGDLECWVKGAPLGSPKWFTSRRTVSRIQRRGGRVPSLDVIWEELGVPETMFSAVAALYLAKHLGATLVRCYGVVDPLPVNGEAVRWERERRVWNEAVAGLGVAVERA